MGRHCYHTADTPDPTYYTPLEHRILSSALAHVPAEGFSLSALRAGIREHSLSDAATQLFPSGAFDLVLFHLRTQRLSLKHRIQFPSPPSSASSTSAPPRPPAPGVGARVRALVLSRLAANIEADVAGPRWGEALALMSLAGNVPASVRELGLLSDEIWYLAGDASVDASWYSKRASLSGVYAATEVFQSQDTSTDFKDTEAFLDRRLEEVRIMGSALRNVREWAGFQGVAAVNLARSLGVRI